MRAGLLDARPLRASPDFRRTWLTGLVSGTGSQIAFVAVLLQMWQLTGSAFAVGLVGLARGLPTLVLLTVGGSLADRIGSRRLLLVGTLGQVAATLLLALQAYAGPRSPALLLGLVAVLAAFSALVAPAARALPARLLPTGLIPAGAALTTLSFQVALLVGPAVGGLLLAGPGVAACHTVAAATLLLRGYAVARLPPLTPGPDAPDRGLAAAVDGWRLVLRTPVLRGALLVDLAATTLAMPVALFPALNEQRFDGDPRTLGLFLSALAVGGVGAGVLSGRVSGAAYPGRVQIVAAATWAVALVGVAYAPGVWVGALALVVAGAADSVSVMSRGALVQVAAPEAWRGRISAAELTVGVAAPELGNVRAGAVAGATSPVVALVSGSALCVAALVAITGTHRELRAHRSHADR